MSTHHHYLSPPPFNQGNRNRQTQLMNKWSNAMNHTNSVAHAGWWAPVSISAEFVNHIVDGALEGSLDRVGESNASAHDGVYRELQAIMHNPSLLYAIWCCHSMQTQMAFRAAEESAAQHRAHPQTGTNAGAVLCAFIFHCLLAQRMTTTLTMSSSSLSSTQASSVAALVWELEQVILPMFRGTSVSPLGALLAYLRAHTQQAGLFALRMSLCTVSEVSTVYQNQNQNQNQMEKMNMKIKNTSHFSPYLSLPANGHHVGHSLEVVGGAHLGLRQLPAFFYLWCRDEELQPPSVVHLIAYTNNGVCPGVYAQVGAYWDPRFCVYVLQRPRTLGADELMQLDSNDDDNNDDYSNDPFDDEVTVPMSEAGEAAERKQEEEDGPPLPQWRKTAAAAAAAAEASSSNTLPPQPPPPSAAALAWANQLRSPPPPLAVQPAAISSSLS